MLLFAPEPRLLSRFARVHLLMPLQKLLKDLVGWLSWTKEPALTRSARRKSWPDLVDRDVEQRSGDDARYHQRRAARQILMPRVPHRFHCLPPANARLGVLQSDAPVPADWTIGIVATTM